MIRRGGGVGVARPLLCTSPNNCSNRFNFRSTLCFGGFFKYVMIEISNTDASC